VQALFTKKSHSPSENKSCTPKKQAQILGHQSGVAARVEPSNFQ
jgi:hypothetical protein